MNKLALIPLAGLALGFASIAPASATTCSTVAACVLGFNAGPGPGGAGVEGQGINDYGVLGVSTNGVGTYGRSTNDFGIVGVTQAVSYAGVYGSATGTNAIGVLGNSTNNYGGAFISLHGIGLYASSEAVDGQLQVGLGNETSVTDEKPSLRSVVGADAGGGGGAGEVFSGNECYYVTGSPHPICAETSSIDGAGNATFFGTVTSNGQAVVRTRSRAGGDVATYGSRAASPTLEDTGTARLVDGAAFVVIDRAFASTIAPGYEVFVTPHGDSNGVYTQATATGFTVRENKGGHSTFTFDYRIVAKPLDAKGARLAAMAPMKRVSSVKPVIPRVTLPRALPR